MGGGTDEIRGLHIRAFITLMPLALAVLVHIYENTEHNLGRRVVFLYCYLRGFDGCALIDRCDRRGISSKSGETVMTPRGPGPV
jgi:hypothetical protein